MYFLNIIFLWKFLSAIFKNVVLILGFCKQVGVIDFDGVFQNLDLTEFEVDSGTRMCCWFPGDLKTRKRTGTSRQIEIHFSIKTTKFLFKYTLLCSQIYDRFIILFIKHNHKVSASFIKEKQRYK